MISFETSQNIFEKYVRRNNIEILHIPHSVKQSSLEENFVSVFSNIGVDVTSNAIEACHRIGKMKQLKKKLYNSPIGNLPNKPSTTGKN